MNTKVRAPARAMHTMGVFLVFLAGGLWIASAATNPPPAARSHPEGLERRVLSATSCTTGWVAVESVVTTELPTSHGIAPVIRWCIVVDHFGGEPAYPVGWPRLIWRVPDAEKDWSGWQQLRIRWMCRTSRSRLPEEAFGYRLGDGRSALEGRLRDARPGEWIEDVIPLQAETVEFRVSRVQFHIAERQYGHGDCLELWIGELALERYTRPVVLEAAPENAWVWHDAPSVRFRLRVAGLQEGKTAAVELRLRQKDRELVRTVRDVNEASASVALFAPSEGWPLGELNWSLGRLGEEAITGTIRVVGSPWVGDREP